MTPEYSLYFHIPFCAHRCAYCDFNTYAGQEDSIPAYVEALCNEIKAIGAGVERSDSAVETRLPVGTIFFGGGTPSLLTPAHYRDIFQNIHRYFEVSPTSETSLEANPGTVSPGTLSELREIGFGHDIIVFPESTDGMEPEPGEVSCVYRALRARNQRRG